MKLQSGIEECAVGSIISNETTVPLLVFVGLRSFRADQTIAKLWDVRWGDSGGGPERNGRRLREPP